MFFHFIVLWIFCVIVPDCVDLRILFPCLLVDSFEIWITFTVSNTRVLHIYFSFVIVEDKDGFYVFILGLNGSMVFVYLSFFIYILLTKSLGLIVRYIPILGPIVLLFIRSIWNTKMVEHKSPLKFRHHFFPLGFISDYQSDSLPLSYTKF